ncbi:MAG: DUF5665 domain-containing protein [Pseudomonadota bacterium]
MTDPNPDPERADMAAELAALRREVATFNGHRFVRIQNSVPRMLMLQFARGLVLGLGTVIGASVLVSIVVYFLSQIEFLPIIGDWALELADQIQSQMEANQSGGIGNGSAAPAPDPVE